jgi:hypothetical protein
VWNWATTPFIQVTWDGTEPPIRQTVSCAGADDEDDDDDPPADELLLELQPAIASAAAVPNATSAAGVFLSPTAGTPSGVMNSASRL